MLNKQDRPLFFALLVVAFALFVNVTAASSAPPQVTTEAQAAANECDKANDARYDRAPIATKVGRWAYCNHDAIEAISGIGAVIVAGVLAVVTGLLWWSTRSLANSTEDLAGGAKTQAAEQREANRLASQANEFAGLSLDEAIKEHGLNWNKWATEQRPRLRVRLVSIRPVVLGGQFYVEFQIANIGARAATITSINVTLSLRGIFENGVQISQSWTGPIPIPQEAIGARESIPISHHTALIFRTWKRANPGVAWIPGQGDIHINGVITYTDDIGVNNGRTGFYRVSTDDPNRFRATGDPDIERDYEYED